MTASFAPTLTSAAFTCTVYAVVPSAFLTSCVMVTSFVPAASVTAWITSAFTVAFTPVLLVFPVAATAASAVTFPLASFVTVTVAVVPSGSFSAGITIVVVSFLVSSEGLVSVVVLPLEELPPVEPPLVLELFSRTTVPPSVAAGMITLIFPLLTVYVFPEYRSFKTVPLFSLTGISTVCATSLIFKPTYNFVPL